MTPCPLHPRYKGVRRPTCRKRACTCRAFYRQQQAAREDAEIDRALTALSQLGAILSELAPAAKLRTVKPAPGVH